MADIELFHKELDAVCVVKTDAQAEILKETGWRKATKAQVEELLVEEGEVRADG